MGTSWEEERGDLQVVKHQFFESGNNFGQFSLSDLKACGEGDDLNSRFMRRNEAGSVWRILPQIKTRKAVRSFHLHNPGHTTWHLTVPALVTHMWA